MQRANTAPPEAVYDPPAVMHPFLVVGHRQVPDPLGRRMRARLEAVRLHAGAAEPPGPVSCRDGYPTANCHDKVLPHSCRTVPLGRGPERCMTRTGSPIAVFLRLCLQAMWSKERNGTTEPRNQADESCLFRPGTELGRPYGVPRDHQTAESRCRPSTPQSTHSITQ
ncbi:hypothetical protein N658DRAFT_5501 [Parathielavia hyrcaniae]|uniref:Uncharacterized protein n=1 Tax=Parathielavia hyrcaniae TaxID=113614 RepID=A0AAN6Q9D9_9PEZI|nr:hypothetical protein N658DRAFT_5501 [Parathielavia hyrcaniae]